MVIHPSRAEWLDLVFKEVAGYDALVADIVDSFLVILNRYEELCKYKIQAPKNFLFHGIPGTGKSHVITTICRHSKLPFNVINAPDIFRPEEGDSERALQSAFQEAERKAPSFLIVDQIDAIASNKDKVHSVMEKRIVTELAELLHQNSALQKNPPVFVIGITSRRFSLDPSLFSFSRFDRSFEMKIPSLQQRFAILNTLTANITSFKVKMGMPAEDIKQLSNITHAFVPSDLQSLCSRALLVALADTREDTKRVTLDHFKKVLDSIHPSVLSEFVNKAEPANIDEIGGLDDILNDIKATIVLPLSLIRAQQEREKEEGEREGKKKEMKTRIPRGVLLYGPSGCGKTLLARSLLSSREHVNFISVQSTEIISKVVGESEKAIKNLFFTLRASAPCILFLDQLEAIARVRDFDTSQANAADRILSCLLTEIDGISADNEANPVIVLGATSRPDLVDPAILRPGRFDTHIFVPPPNEEQRLDILTKVTKKMAVEVGLQGYLPSLAKKTNYFSGADLDSLCREAGLLCLREDLKNTEIKIHHFDAALRIVTPTLKPRDYVQFNH